MLCGLLLLHNLSAPYRQAEARIELADRLRMLIQAYHEQRGAWPRSLADLEMNLPFPVQFYPDGTNRLACVLTINSEFNINVYKAGQIELARNSGPVTARERVAGSSE